MEADDLLFIACLAGLAALFISLAVFTYDDEDKE